MAAFMEQKRQDYGTASAFMMQLHSAVEAGPYETEKMAAGNHHGELTDHAAAEVAKAHHGSSTYKLDEWDLIVFHSRPRS